MRWGGPRSDDGEVDRKQCYYCRRVHRVKEPYCQMPLKKAATEANSNEKSKAEWMSYKNAAVEPLQENPSALIDDSWLDRMKVNSLDIKGDRIKRGYTNYNLDVFEDKFPEKFASKKGYEVFERTDIKGKVTKWVKVWDDEDGVERGEAYTDRGVMKVHEVHDNKHDIMDGQTDEMFSNIAAARTGADEFMGTLTAKDLPHKEEPRKPASEREVKRQAFDAGSVSSDAPMASVVPAQRKASGKGTGRRWAGRLAIAPAPADAARPLEDSPRSVGSPAPSVGPSNPYQTPLWILDDHFDNAEGGGGKKLLQKTQADLLSINGRIGQVLGDKSKSFSSFDEKPLTDAVRSLCNKETKLLQNNLVHTNASVNNKIKKVRVRITVCKTGRQLWQTRNTQLRSTSRVALRAALDEFHQLPPDSKMIDMPFVIRVEAWRIKWDDNNRYLQPVPNVAATLTKYVIPELFHNEDEWAYAWRELAADVMQNAPNILKGT